ncbi:MAG: hypothetical protein HKP61_12510 [Dactylosporangium sp.]|nr:hypothetical protein [Dactylosporangium sp.]NNJ61742.1 hypothetical protein [Dactylosporangium sp.]
MTAALAGKGWQATLESLYPDHPLVRYGDHPFPIWAIPATPDDQTDLEAALGTLNTSTQPSFDRYDVGFDADGRPSQRGYDPNGAAEFAQHMGQIRSRSRHNGPAYAFDRLRTDGARMVLDARPGTYFDSVATSEVLERELLDALAAHPDDRIPLAALPRRRWLHDRLARSGHDTTVITDGRFRAAALSVSAAMLMVRPDGGVDALLARRSVEVLTHPNLFHVAPSGLLAPPPGTPIPWRQGFSVRRTILQELAEELPGHEGIDLNIRYCGISVPLLTLRPEICLVILVRDPDALRRRTTFNWEYCGLHHLPLNSDLTPRDGAGIVHPTRLVPHAAAALHLATTVARSLL